MAKAVELLHKVPLPCSHPTSIALHADGVWVADLEGRELILTDPATGAVLRRIPAVVRRPHTISWDGRYLWECDEETSRLFKRSVDNGETYLYGTPPGVNIPYLGMTCRNGALWILSPDQPDFTVHNNHVTVIEFPRHIQAETFEAPTYACRGLCHDGTNLWTLDTEAREVFAVDPDRGTIFTSYVLPDVEQPSSLVITEDRIHTMDLKSNCLHSYRLDRSVRYTTSGGRRSRVQIVNTFRNHGPGTVKRMEFYQALPADYRHQRLSAPVRCTPAPDERVEAQWDEGVGVVAAHVLRDLEPGREEAIVVGLDVETVNLKFHLYPDRTGSLAELPGDIRRNYLFEEMLGGDPELTETVRRAQILFQSGAKEIRDRVDAILEGETNAFWVARKIFNWVVDSVQYVLPYTSLSSRRILKQGKGSCGNHATVYIALCQAAGLPARSVIGFGLWKDDSRLGYLDHEIPEVYLPGYGWVPADTSRFMSLPVYGTHPLTKFLSFGTLSDRFFVNGFGRDLRSPFARRRHRQERLVACEGLPNIQERFFLRWDSEPMETWTQWVPEES